MSKRHRATRTESQAPQQVYGVDLDSLMPILHELWESVAPKGDGLATVKLTGSHERLAPLLRASLRAEAELLMADAAQPGSRLHALRTPANRRCDAVMLLTWRALAAMGGQSYEHNIRALLNDTEAPAMSDPCSNLSA